MRTIDVVGQKFPHFALRARKLYLRDENFRSICEDLVLAMESLRNFEVRKDAPFRPEIKEYRCLVCELEDEIRSFLNGDANR